MATDEYMSQGANQAPGDSAHIADPGTQRALQRHVRIAARLAGAPAASVTKVEGRDVSTLCAHDEQSGAREPGAAGEDHAFARRIAGEARPLAVQDSSATGNTSNGRILPDSAYRSYLGVPLIDERGTVLGALAVADVVPRDWTQDDIASLEDLAAIAAPLVNLLPTEDEPGSSAYRNAMTDAALDGIFTIDRDTRIIDMNPATERIFGFPRGTCVGNRMVDLIIPMHQQQSWIATFEQWLIDSEHDPDPLTQEHEAVRSAGSPVLVEMAVARIDVPHQSQPRFTVSVRDVTEQKRTEEEIRLFRNMVESVGQAIIANDNSPERRITYWNPAAESLLGWTADEAVGRGFYEIVPAPEFIGKVREIGRQVRRVQSWQGEFQLQHRDGHIIPALATVNPITDSNGQFLGVISSYTDTTALKESERTIRLYKNLTDAVGQALIANADDRSILYWNKAAEQLFGWTEDEVIGRDIYDIAPADDVVDQMAGIGQYVRRGHMWSGEFKLKRKDGTDFPVLMNVSPVLDESDNVVQIVGAYTDITEFKETEREIRFFQRVVEAIGEAVVATSMDGEIIYVNRAAERMLAWSRDELIGKVLLEHLPDPDYLEPAKEIAALVRTGVPWFGEFSLRRRDGSTFPALISLAPIFDEHGQTDGVISVYSEITDMKRTEQENRFFKHIVEAVGQVVIANDVDRNITYWNQAAEDVLGWKAEEVIGKDAATIVPAPHFLDTIPLITQRVRSGHAWIGEFPIQHRDGTIIPALATLKPMYGESNELIGVLAVHTDIRELKRTEEELRSHKHIVDAVGEAAIVSDRDGRITYWNKAAEEIYGWSAEEALGQIANELLAAPGEIERAESVTRDVEKGDTWSGEFLVRRRDGTEFPAYFTVSPIRNADHEIVGVIGVSHDISDRKEYERQIEFHKVMLDAVGQTIVATDTNRVITYWSKGAEHALGWSADEVLGHNIAEFAPAAHLQEEAGELHRKVRTGESWSGEFPIRRKDGSTFPAVVNLAPIHLEGQGTVGVIGVYTDVTELKETEEQLRLHKRMLDAVGQAVCATDENHRVTYWNRAAEELFGYSFQDAVGKNLLEFLPQGSEAQRNAADALESVAREGSWTGELSTFHKDGSEIAAVVSVSPVKREDGRQMGLIISLADISARRHAEQALKESSEQISRILETMSDGFLSIDRDWIIHSINRQAEVFLNRSRHDLIGKEIWQEFPGASERAFFQQYQHVVDTGEPVSFTEYYPLLDAWFEVNATSSGDRISVFFRDVTERRTQELALREAEERYRTLVEQLPAVTYIAAADDLSKILYVSPQHEFVFGHTVEEWLANEDKWRDAIHPDDLALVVESDRDSVENRESFTIEYRLRQKNGEYLWVRDSARLIRDEDGTPRYWQGISHDITAEKQAERITRENEQRYRSLFDHHPDAVFSIDRVGRVLSANPAFEFLTGRQAPAPGELNFEELVVPKDRERVQERFEQTHLGHAQEFHAAIINTNGETVELGITSIPIIVDHEIVGVHVVAQDVTIHRELENQLAHQAYHDSLTGLPNRSLFQSRLAERLEEARLHGNSFAVLFFDLDDFKVINDSLGHSAGDQLLVQAAGRVQTCIRTGDLIARLGGDEFTLLLEHIDGEHDAVIIAERIAQVLDHPFIIDGHEVYATTSVGIAIGDSASPSSDDILRNADMAMYEAKNSGKNRYAMFEPGMNSRAWLRLTVETEMRRGIPRGEFQVYYQPIFDLQTGDLTGVEALVRWNHPERGFLAPDQFISIAEQSGLILPLGRWVIREASTQLHAWQERFSDRVPLRLSLNLSSKQYQHPRLIDELTRSLESTQFDPTLITLEITESIAMDDSPLTLETLQRLKDVGVQLALDDFGTGFSALSYLRRFPIDNIKIDQSFIAGLGHDSEDTSIVQAVMAASHAMKLTVTAEGIETVEQLNLLQELGCNFGQGFLFSHPLPSEQMGELIEQSPNVRQRFWQPESELDPAGDSDAIST